MPWSTSGTWTNEAAKTVTAVASVTGGIRVTAAAHGYANGDFVELVSLGTYNGAYFVSNVTTDTFDMVNQYKQDGTLLSFGATDSGTAERGAKDFSGITGVTNVSRIVNNNRDFVYQSSGTDVEIKINGAICIDPKFETVILNRAVGNGKNALAILSGGILQIGKPDLENSYYDFPSGVAFIFPISSTSSSFTYQEGYSPFRTETGGYLKWLTGTIYCSGPIAWYGYVLCMSQNCILSSRNVDRPQIRQRSSHCVIKGLTTHDYKFTAIKNAVEFAGYVPIQSTSAIDMSSSGSDNVWYTFYDLIAGRGNDKEVGIKNEMWVRLVNVNKGSDITIAAQSPGSTGQQGVCEIREELTIIAQEQDGTVIENCRVFIRDTNHSHRLAGNTYNNNPSYTSDRTYGGLTASTGKIAFNGNTGSVLLTVFHRPDDGAAGNDVWDSRGNDNDKTDLFSVGFAKYGFIAAIVTYELKGTGGLEKPFTLFEDTGIVVASSSTVAAYTSLGTLSKIYDRAQQWVAASSDNMEEVGLGNMVVTKAGKTIDFGNKNVYLDSAASEVFDYTDSTSRVDIKISGLASTADYTGMKATTFHLADEIDLENLTFDGDLHVNLGADGTIELDNCTVTGNIYNDDASHTLVVNLTGGASATAGDAGTGDGQTDVRQTVYIEVTVKDISDNSVIPGARVYLEAGSGGDLTEGVGIVNTLTNASGVVSISFNFTNEQPVVGRVRKGSSATGYKTAKIVNTITNAGLTITVLMVKDY